MVVRSCRVWMTGGFSPADILIDGQRISRILPYGRAEAYCGEQARDIGELYDFGELRVLPGFIDIHTHGALGFDTNDGEPEGLRRWMESLPYEGVTSFLPTTVTQDEDALLRALENTDSVMAEACEGAEILGIHMEGPFIDRKHRGCHPSECIREASVEGFMRYQEAAGGHIIYLSLAPEHDRGFELIRYCRSHGVTVSMGHSGADFETALLAASEGASSVTHTFNAMSAFKHRDLGLAGASLYMRELYSEIICDLVNVAPEAVNIFFRAKGKERGIMVSDSLSVKGLPAGSSSRLGGLSVTVDEKGLARLSDGTIAGSTMRMNEGLKNLVEKCGVDLETAVNSCTINPAGCLGIEKRKGRIAAGGDADLVVLEEDYSIRQCFCRGIASVIEN